MRWDSHLQKTQSKDAVINRAIRPREVESNEGVHLRGFAFRGVYSAGFRPVPAVLHQLGEAANVVFNRPILAKVDLLRRDQPLIGHDVVEPRQDHPLCQLGDVARQGYVTKAGHLLLVFPRLGHWDDGSPSPFAGHLPRSPRRVKPR